LCTANSGWNGSPCGWCPIDGKCYEPDSPQNPCPESRRLHKPRQCPSPACLSNQFRVSVLSTLAQQGEPTYAVSIEGDGVYDITGGAVQKRRTYEETEEVLLTTFEVCRLQSDIKYFMQKMLKERPVLSLELVKALTEEFGQNENLNELNTKVASLGRHIFSGNPEL
jgi:hypothetical protein